MQKKPFRVAALCLLCLLLPAVPVAAQEDDGYVDIGETSIGTLSLYVPSVEVREHYSGSYIVGFVMLEYSDIGAENYARNGVKPHHSMDLVAANPKARQVQLISETFYNECGRYIYSNSGSFNPSAWNECPPGTGREAVWLALMEAAGYR